LESRAYYDIVENYCGLARITGKSTSPHIFKHTCISKMVRASMSANEIQQHVGNASLQTLQNYIHLNNQDIKTKVKSALTVEQKDPMIQ
jgi:site-specific recombinase XerD